MQNLQQRIENAWEAVDRQRDAAISEGTQNVNANIEAELASLLRAVQTACSQDEREIEKDVLNLIQMAEQYNAGVLMWQQKAQSSIKTIEEKQRSLGALVQEVSIRTQARKELLLTEQSKRAAETNEKCIDLLRTTC